MTPRITGNQVTRNLANDIREQQQAIAEIREQLSSGKRINRPSDDPAHAARLIGLDAAQAQLTQYSRNASAAESRLTLEENALSSATNSLERVRELALRAAGGGLSDSERQTIAGEIRGRLDELYDAANARDAAGDYLFAGSRADTRPFERGTPVVFNGNAVGRELPLGSARSVTSGDSGMEAFVRVPRGNGQFVVEADAANTGGAVIATGTVTDASAFRGADYRIEFTSPTTFDVVDADSGAVVLAGQDYVDREPIAIEGLTTHVTGEPAAGDVFHIRSGERQDLFTTVARLGELLDGDTASEADRAKQRQGIDGSINDIERALNGLNALRGRVGTRLQIIDSSREENEAISLQLARTTSDIEDVDVADAITRLEDRAFALEAVQKSWARVGNLSLFNYL